jgi:hypothetical protein
MWPTRIVMLGMYVSGCVLLRHSVAHSCCASVLHSFVSKRAIDEIYPFCIEKALSVISISGGVLHGTFVSR